MPDCVPMAIVGKMLGKGITIRFDAIPHINDLQSSSPEKLDEGVVYTVGLGSSRRIANPQSPRRDDEYDNMSPSAKLGNLQRGGSQGLTGNILVANPIQVGCDNS